MAVKQSEMVKKFKIAPFLNIGTKEAPNWVRVRKSTSFDLSLNPETQDYDYIADGSPTTELLRYKPSLSLPITMYKGEPDYDLAFDKFYNLKTGTDAKAQLLIVFFMEKATKDAEQTVHAYRYTPSHAETVTVYSADGTDFYTDAEKTDAAALPADVTPQLVSGEEYRYTQTVADAPVTVYSLDGASFYSDVTLLEAVTVPASYTPELVDGADVTQTVQAFAGYKAWLNECVLSVQNLNSVDSPITVQADFGGHIDRGTVRKVDGVITFTADEVAEGSDDDALTW